MVGEKTRQWYRMSVAEALRELAVDPSIGVTNTTNRETVEPHFIQKDTWHLYSYSVLRNSTHKKVAIDKLVIGDIVALRSGDIVPTDMRLLTAKSVTVLEDTITGSAAPSHKRTFASTSLLPKTEQKNMLFAGTEVLSGIAVGLVVTTKQGTHTKQPYKQTQYLKKRGITIQSPNIKKILPLIDCVVFDDLQQEQEIYSLIQKLYLEKSVATIFFVHSKIAQHIKKQLPETVIRSTVSKPIVGGVAVYSNVTDAQKARLLVSCKNQSKRVLYIHRGDERGLMPKIADVNFVISSTASQAALRQADLIAPRISISTLASILHNNK